MALTPREPLEAAQANWPYRTAQEDHHLRAADGIITKRNVEVGERGAGHLDNPQATLMVISDMS